MIAQDGEYPHEGPAVGMQLGRGHVNLRQQCPLEARKWERKPNSFKNGGVEEQERLSSIDTIVRPYEFAICVKMNRNIGVALSPKDTPNAVRLFVPILPHILAGSKSGGLGEEFSGSPRVEGSVIYVGRTIISGFCSSHFKEKATKEKKEGRNEGLVEDDGATRRNPEKQRLKIEKIEKT